MLIAFAFIALAAGCATLVLLPLRLPWPQRVRWLVATNALGYWGVPTEPVVMREVFVVDLTHDRERLRVVVRHAGTSGPDTRLGLDGPGVVTSTAPQLARWRAAGTPLLVVSEGTGRASLHGPTRAVCGLRVLDRGGSREAVSWSTA